MNDPGQFIGLIGLGLLGTAMAERLLASGHRVWGYDLRPEPRNALAASGGKGCERASEVLENAEVVLLSLPDSGVSRALLSEERASLRSGQTVIDTTTGDPEEMTAMGRMLEGAGVAYIEATVAGSSSQLRAGAGCLFLGGAEAAIRRVEPVLDALAARRFHLGPVGSASRFKLVHNLVLGLNRAALAEGLAFAESLGFSREAVLEVLEQTPAASAIMASKGPKMVAGDYRPQARLVQHLKDVRLIAAAARRAGQAVPLCRVHEELLERAVALGFGDADNAAVIEAYRRGAGDRD